MELYKTNKIYNIKDEYDDDSSISIKGNILYGLYFRDVVESSNYILSVSFNAELLDYVKNNYLEDSMIKYSWISEVNIFQIEKKNFFIRIKNFFSNKNSFFDNYLVRKIKFFCYQYKIYSSLNDLDKIICKDNNEYYKVSQDILMIDTKNISLEQFEKIRKIYDTNDFYFSKCEINLDYWYPLSIKLDVYLRINYKYKIKKF